MKTIYTLLVPAFAAVLFAAEAGAQPSAEEPNKRFGDKDAPRDAGSKAFGDSSITGSQASKDSERGAASRSAISGEGVRQVPRSDTFSGMSGRTGRGGAPMGGGGGRR